MTGRAHRHLLVLVAFGGAVAGLLIGLLVGRGPLAGPGTESPVLRLSESPGPAASVTDGPLSFSVLAWRCGLVAVTGDHADWIADGEYCRLRVRMENLEVGPASFETPPQTAISDDGTEFQTDVNAMQVANQPTRIDVKGKAAYEFDLWFDVPKSTRIVAVEFRAEADSPGRVLRLTP